MVEVTIPIGPQHPALKEPEYFTLKVDGETIVDVDVRLGYAHRGIEKAAESRDYIQNIYLIERVCGICSHSHTTAFVQGVEELMHLEVPKRGLYIRTLVGELERVHSHLLWVGVAGHEVGFDTLFMYTWRDREIVQDILEMISGNRVNYAMNTIGGVRRDISDAQISTILRGVKKLEERTKYYLKVATSESTFLARASGVGYLKKEVAKQLCAVGPTARGSGVDIDARRDDKYAAYGEIPFEVITTDMCDVLGRAYVRVMETVESCKMIKYMLEHLPSGPYKAEKSPSKVPPKVPTGEVVSYYEAPRGEDIHYIKSNGTNKPERVKIRAPTLANFTSIAECLKGGNIADVPLVIAAIDPCMSCTDRMIVADVNEWTKKVVTMDELRKLGNCRDAKANTKNSKR